MTTPKYATACVNLRPMAERLVRVAQIRLAMRHQGFAPREKLIAMADDIMACVTDVEAIEACRRWVCVTVNESQA